jgi:2-oxoisovalerate dehydrogenase E1 component alpha subunit
MALSKDTMREMFWTMLLSRRLDERAWVLHRQGKIAFHISGIGHEASQIGAAYALRRGHDWVTPYYRDLGLMVAMGYTPRDFMLGLMGKSGEPTSGGRQMPSHWSLKNANVVSHSAPVATQAPHASGIALAIKMKKEDKVVLSTVGEGSTSQGEWYEAVNWAAVHQLPVIFLIENNMYAISVPTDKQMAVPSAADKACGLGLDGRSVDGTDVFAVYETVFNAAEKARRGEGPTVVEAVSYRITPHSSDDDDRTYRSREEVEEHKKKDPLIVARNLLENAGILTPKVVDEMEDRAKEMIAEAVTFAQNEPYPPVEYGMGGVYAREVNHG